ncbi:hypothetical protein [Halobellus inordinatus]|uniref:hypothetical protein n=1 Tax=Halobellus inordinatus TaxID=1126236 RepID=UPI00210E4E58|nr:hypothetical protein [Halobellus inordinatus]
MALQLSRAFTDGIDRVTTRTGGILFALLLLQQFLLLASLNTVLGAQVPPAAADALGLSLPVPTAVAGVVLIGAFLFSAVYFVMLSRALTRPKAQLASFPSELYTRRIGWASLTMLVAGVVSAVATMIGFFLLILPGLFLAPHFVFLIFAVGVEDRGVVGSLKRSWGLAKGNRLRLFVIVLLVAVSGMLIGVVPTVFQLAGAPALGDIASVLINGILYTFVYGIIAAAYVQLADDTGDRGPESTTSSTTPSGRSSAEL